MSCHVAVLFVAVVFLCQVRYTLSPHDHYHQRSGRRPLPGLPCSALSPSSSSPRPFSPSPAHGNHFARFLTRLCCLHIQVQSHFTPHFSNASGRRSRFVRNTVGHHPLPKRRGLGRRSQL
eukprot:g42061.t1